MDSIVIDYGLDPSGYMTGVGQIAAGNTALQQSMAGVTTGSTVMQKALAMITPTRAAGAALTGFAVQAAATEKSLSGLEATSTVTGVSVGKLAGGIRQMARDFPIGNDGAAQLVSQFTKMGVASKGSEGQILKLSTSVAKIAGATGESTAAIADGMTTLARITGNTNLNPKRFSDLGDSLTTVALKSGASASGILSLSKNIAPMANAAGIGATGVLGISSAFARLGEDGLGASTAVNKMLSDMNKSVRDGGPEIMKYATIVGKTTKEFKSLFEANPTEAITQVTEALAKAGTAGPRQLESIGLDGVRTQRILQAAMATGGLRPGVSDAVAGYGSGASGKAAASAYGGLSDSLTELQAASASLASSFGAPLLSPLTAFTKGLTAATGVFGKVAASSGVQNVLKVVGGLVGAGILAKTITGAAATLGLGRQIATSGGVRSLAAGIAGGRGDTNSWMSRFGGRATFLAGSQVDRYGVGGQLGHVIDPKTGESVQERDSNEKSPTYGKMIPKMRITGNLERSLYMRGQGLGEGLGPVGNDGRGGLLGGIGRGIRAYGGNFITSYADSARANLWNQSGARGTDPFRRQDSWRPSQGFRDAFDASRKATGSTGFSGGMFRPEGMAAFNTSLTGLNAASMKTSTVMMALAKSAGQAALMTASLARSGFGVVGQGLKGGAQLGLAGARRVAGSVLGLAGGGIGLGLMAGMAGYSAYQGNEAKKAEQLKEFSTSDINSTINAYREQSGQATKAVVTVAQTGADYAKSVTAAVKTMAQAKAASPEDFTAAALTQNKITNKYVGTSAQQAAQIAGTSVTGITASDMQNIKLDVIKSNPGITSVGVKDIIDKIPKSSLTGSGDLPNKPIGSGSKELLDALSPFTATGALGPKEKDSQGLFSWLSDKTTLSPMSVLNKNVGKDAGWAQAIDAGVGGGQHQTKLTDDTIKGLQNVVQSSNQRRSAQGETYSPEYAQQEQLKGFEDILKATAKTGNAEAYASLSSMMTNSLTGGKSNAVLSPEMLTKSGGLAGAVSSVDADYAKRNAAYNKDRAAQPGGKYDPVEKQNIDSIALAKSAPLLSKLFDDRGAKPGSKEALSAAAANAPEDLSALDKAVKAMTNSVGDSAKSLGDLESQAAAAAAGLTEGSPKFIQAMAIQERAGMKKEAAYKQMLPSEVMSLEIPKMLKLAMNRDNTPTGEAQRKAGLSGLDSMQTQIMGQMTARVQAQRSSDVQKGIAREDYGTQRGYQIQDYSVQVMRTTRDFNKNRARADEDFNKNRKRAEEDYGIQRVRQVRDFNISIAHAEKDAQTSRFRALRDFNIQVKREIEDAASTMYDPYSRIQTKPTWDSANMTSNIEEQTAALVKQKKQLDELRKKGLSAQTIDQLGLGKAENAQQVDNLAADAMTDPGGVAKLNAAAKAKAAAAGTMVLDSSNKDLRRSREELAKSLKDNADDLAKNLKWSKQELVKNLTDQAFEFKKNLARTSTDYKISLTRNSFDLAVALGDMEYQQNISLDRQEKAFVLSMGRIDRALLEADKGVGQDFKQLSDSYNKAIHGTAVNWQKTMVNDSTKMVGIVSGTLVPALAKAWSDAGLPLPGAAVGVAISSGVGNGANANSGGMRVRDRAEGGTIPGFSPHPKADNILINATAGEFMQPVDAVQHYGVNTMEKIRTKQIPKAAFDKYEGYMDGGWVGMWDWAHKKFPGTQKTSDYRPGGTSYHGKGSAIDLAPPNIGIFNAIKSTFGTKIAELIYTPAGNRQVKDGHDVPASFYAAVAAAHYNHVHWAMPPNGGGTDPVTGSAIAGAASDGAGGLSKAAIDKVMKLAPKGGLFYTNLLKHFETSLRSAFEGKGQDAVIGGPTTTNTNSKLGQAMAKAAHNWVGNQWSSLNTLWTGESGWNNNAQNPTSTAYGIAQFLDSTWSGYGGPKTSDAALQIKYGMNYIDKRYGTPANALAKWQSRSPHWYDQGGQLPSGTSLVHNGTGAPETVLNAKQSKAMQGMLSKDQGNALHAACGMHMTVIHNENITYDNRNDFGGSQITVQAQDPNEMGRQLEAKQTRSRLTQTRGVRAR